MRASFVVFYSYVVPYFAYTIQALIDFDKCSDSENEPIGNFDIASYLGTWYEQYRYSIVPELGDVCTRVKVTHAHDGSLQYAVTYLSKWIDDFVTVVGRIRFDAPDIEGKLLIDFPARDNFAKFSMRYRIVETDYKTYSVVTSCENKRGFNLRNVWIFTRNEFPSRNLSRTILRTLQNNKLPTAFLFKIEHANCYRRGVETDNETELKIESVDLETDVEVINSNKIRNNSKH